MALSQTLTLALNACRACRRRWLTLALSQTLTLTRALNLTLTLYLT